MVSRSRPRLESFPRDANYFWPGNACQHWYGVPILVRRHVSPPGALAARAGWCNQVRPAVGGSPRSPEVDPGCVFGEPSFVWFFEETKRIRFSYWGTRRPFIQSNCPRQAAQRRPRLTETDKEDQLLGGEELIPQVT